MSVSIDIIPSSDSIDMIGDADQLSSYSLSGHVSIALTSPFALYGPRRTVRILLHSVTLTFEGQSEVLTPLTGYSAVRLCTKTFEIPLPEPVEMNNEGHEDSGKPCFWNVLFDMPIPGWLPATTVHGVETAGTRYNLFADARYTLVSDNDNSSFSFSTLCSPFRSRMRTVEAQKHIVLRRLVAPHEGEDPRVTYLINPKFSNNSKFPSDVLSSIQVLATVPEQVDIEHHALPVTIRMRTKNLDASRCKRIRVSTVSMNLIQKEKYRYDSTSMVFALRSDLLKFRSSIAEGYNVRYPISPPKEQPPHHPLRDPHPMAGVYETGLGACMTYKRSVSRDFSILPPGESGVHYLGDNNCPFANDADNSAEEQTWYTLESSVPFVHRAADDRTIDWAGSSLIQPTVHSPLVTIIHEAVIELTCAYILPETDEVVSERLSFTIPLRFRPFAAKPSSFYSSAPPPSPCVQPHSSQSGPLVPFLPPTKPYSTTLPAYSQLFDHNGDRKIDFNVPLPLYTPRASPNASSCSLDSDYSDLEQGTGMHEQDPLLRSRCDL
ncbi:hypothetical protein H0H93_012267 [Arthromyces matolae]|nr:hypothetical protein H0H93_012267 [Arthromyces matolae]